MMLSDCLSHEREGKSHAFKFHCEAAHAHGAYILPLSLCVFDRKGSKGAVHHAQAGMTAATGQTSPAGWFHAASSSAADVL